MSGLPEAESDDQSWMAPNAPTRRAVEYNEFNPRPEPPKRPSPEEQTAEYTRRIYRFLMGAAIGALVGVAIYIAYLLLT